MPSVISLLITSILGFLPFSLTDICYIFKYIYTFLFLRIHKKFRKGRLDFYDLKSKDPEKVGFVVPPIEEELESPCSDTHLTKADDEIFCYGVNSKTECLIIGIARLSNEEARANLHLRLANGKTYQLDKVYDFQQATGRKNAFSCGGLQMHYICPFRRWRIFFSGFLKETSDESPNSHRMVYVKFSFLWRASSDVYDNTSDMNESSIAKAAAKAEWKSIVPPTQSIHTILDSYAQAGVIMGNVTVDDGVQDYEMYLFGERLRYRGDMFLTKETEFSLLLGYVHKNGLYIHVGRLSAANVAEDLIYGFVIKPSGEIKKLQTVNLTHGKSSNGENEIKGSIVAGLSYAFCGTLTKKIFKKDNYENFDTVQFYLNGKKGTGVYIKGKHFGTSTRRKINIIPETTIPDLLFPMVVLFTEHLCELPEITGGKGSSLGKLTQLSGKLKSFTVPSGMVVTTSSYEEFITKDILNEIKNLENVLHGNTAGDPKEACRRVQAKVAAAKIPNNIRDNIVKNLIKIFGDRYPVKKLAVRSSATGEDTDQMSAAGQMDTYLGVSGLANILLAVKKCWASQFGFIAVQYKRRYGQCLNSPMAVVIQEMVPCDVAGVLFTCDPVTGNPTKMSIAANFGLGETVVSGSEEPDSIELSRDHLDEIKINNVIVGSKNRKIVVTDTGTGLDEIPESERQNCCLSAEKTLELGRLAIEIEKHYRSRRDIEWGIHNNNIYIFQSRPVTSGTQETDFEIEHEFDGPLRMENEYFSVSNAAEVMPGAISPLCVETFFRSSNIVWQGENEVEWQVPVKTKYFMIGWMTVRNHSMFSIGDLIRGGDPDNISNLDKASMISFFGRILDDREIYQATADKYSAEEEQSQSYTEIIESKYNRYKCLFFANWKLKQTLKKYSSYRIPVEKYKTSKELFNALMNSCTEMGPSLMCHMVTSMGSSAWNENILTTLLQAKKELDTDVYTDFAAIITNKGDVESADVPAAIQRLAVQIQKSTDPIKFKEMKTEDALLWLQTSSTAASKQFKEFLNKHGHRCLKEFDISTITWGDDPKPLVTILQNLVGNIPEHDDSKKNPSILQLLSQLKVQLGLLDKLKLLFYVPLCRNAVRQREASKSLLVKTVDAWRKGYRALAKMMVSEGRIPNENLLFFMTIEEIKELLDNRSPAVIAKAYHRQKLAPKMDAYKFPEIMKGFPRPLCELEDDVKPEEGVFSMKGIPVSQGVAKGYVRVCTSLKDAAGLKPGEIMLAYSTDIGWSPYFPSLAGVATELGGLISHGAVVSREYGLPCVCGLHGATRRFQTGDYVLLDGNKGFLQKLEDLKEK